MKQEKLPFLASNPFYTKRFAFYVGRRCRSATIKDVAEELHLDWHTVKELEKQYMREQVRRAGTPAPKVIGIDEISIKKRHVYRILVSDLVRERPIWFGGKDRSEASMDEFFKWLGPKKSAGIRMAVMDMWRPFRTSTQRHAPKASVLFDKFHVLRQLGEALDTVRKSEYGRLSGKDRRFIKGQTVHPALRVPSPCASPRVVIDFKTKEFTDPADVKGWPEHAIQLAAYAHGLGLDAWEDKIPERWNLFVSNNAPGVLKPVMWDAEDYDRDLEMFTTLLRYWQLEKGYAPRPALAA